MTHSAGVGGVEELRQLHPAASNTNGHGAVHETYEMHTTATAKLVFAFINTAELKATGTDTASQLRPNFKFNLIGVNQRTILLTAALTHGLLQLNARERCRVSH